MNETITIPAGVTFSGRVNITSTGWVGVDCSAGALIHYTTPIAIYKAASPPASVNSADFLFLDPADGGWVTVEADLVFDQILLLSGSGPSFVDVFSI